MRFYLILLVLFTFASAEGQLINTDGRLNVVSTAVPFLSITPDSRSGAMGDAGVALDPDANNIHWNPAKLAFMDNPYGLAISYTPWLKNLVPDINLSYLSGYYKIDKLSGFGASMRYFTLGEINFTDANNQELQKVSPNEIALDAAYARKLSENFSVGVALRFIYSNLSGTGDFNGGSMKPGIGFAGDASMYYTRRGVTVGDYKADWSLGMNMSNIGSKISYQQDNDADFIPINLKLGGYFNIHIDKYNELGFTVDFNKLMVPTRPYVHPDSFSSGQPVIIKGKSNDVGVPEGMIQSFTDAPNGFKEEMREISPSIGLEYWYARTFALRAGYFYEHPTKGNRQFVTLGFGIKYNTMAFDFSYLLDASKSVGTSPLANTLRFSLKFDFNQNTTTEKEG